MTKENAILFNDEGIRAILEGRKTQFRVPIEPQPQSVEHHPIGPIIGVHADGRTEQTGWRSTIDLPFDRDGKDIECPYGEVGDKLWVKEDFAYWEQGVAYKADGQWLCAHNKSGHPDVPDEINRLKLWESPTLMPRWASRIMLEIVSVGVQRIQTISADDMYAEGVETPLGIKAGRPCLSFQILWNSIYGDQGFGWDKDPWVWAITFKILEAN